MEDCYYLFSPGIDEDQEPVLCSVDVEARLAYRYGIRKEQE